MNLSLRYLFCLLIITPVFVIGQSLNVDKLVYFPKGKMSLKSVLKTMSVQTGCVFSYDPTKIPEQQSIIISSGNPLKLQEALQILLPVNVKYKLRGKYIVLQKGTSQNLSTMKMQSALPAVDSSQMKAVLKITETQKINNTVDLLVDIPPSVLQKIDTVLSNRPLEISETIHQTDSSSINASVSARKVTSPSSVISNEAASTESSGQSIVSKSEIAKVSNPNVVNFVSQKGFLELELATYNKINSFSFRAGAHSVYLILSIANYPSNFYMLGIGAGMEMKLNDQFGFNLELVRNTLVSGKSYKIGVRGTMTQFRPELNYRIGENFKVFGAPTIHSYKTSYLNKETKALIDFPKNGGFGIILGVRVDMIGILF